MKAYRTVAMGVESIVFAKGPPQAKYLTWRDANEAGYEISFGDITSVKRVPGYDVLAHPANTNKCHIEEYLQAELKEMSKEEG